MINTMIGPRSVSELAVVTETEKIPCGSCLTTKYFYEGNLVRQDIRIDVDEAFLLVGQTGV